MSVLGGSMFCAVSHSLFKMDTIPFVVLICDVFMVRVQLYSVCNGSTTSEKDDFLNSG